MPMTGEIERDLSFPKRERLHHRSLVEGLFKEGESFYEFPFRVIWRVLSPDMLQKNFRHGVPEDVGSLQMMVTVPKKKRKKAVDRVLLRRRIREAYRLNRLALRDNVESTKDIATLSVAFIYVHDKNLEYQYIDKKISMILCRLIENTNGAK